MTTWILLRAAGVGAYVMLFMAVAWGLVATTAVVTKHVSKPAANMFHQFVATTGLVLLGVHMAILLIDAYMPFHVLDLLVPMRSTFRPVAITAGVIAMYAMVAVMVSSWVRKKLSTKVWRSIHLLAVPAFTLALAHGVFSGTDTQRWWMFGMYALTGLIVVFLVIVRGLSYGYRAPRP
ncbi:MAG: ferric reductase-like transmembrane domain-containing protein, partial [Actinomycetota bacterium]